MPSEDTKLQVLAEHYKNSCEILFLKIKQREKTFIFALILLCVILFQLYTPQEATQVLSQLISSHLGIDTDLNFLFVESVIWFSLLAIILKYFQSVAYIERQYDYIHTLEEYLCKHYENPVFTREGLSYLKHYPCFLNWTSFLYTIFFPILFIIIIFCKIIRDFQTMGMKSLLFWFNGFFFITIVISTIFYLTMMHEKK